MSRKITNKLLPRIDMVDKMLCRGQTHLNIVRYCAENYHVGSKMTDVYITMVYQRWADQVKPIKEQLQFNNIKIDEEIRSLAIQKDDLKVALDANDKISDKLGLFDKEDKRHSLTREDLEDLDRIRQHGMAALEPENKH